jgi:hypothetical protein
MVLAVSRTDLVRTGDKAETSLQLKPCCQGSLVLRAPEEAANATVSEQGNADMLDGFGEVYLVQVIAIVYSCLDGQVDVLPRSFSFSVCDGTLHVTLHTPSMTG